MRSLLTFWMQLLGAIKSTIRIDTAVSGKVDVFVNGKQVLDE